MRKFIIIATLLTLSAASVANTTAPETEINLTPADTFTSVRNLPVIVQNEVIATNMCRISFENGTSRDVPCDMGRPLPEAIAKK